MKKCFFCNKIAPLPYHVTEIENQQVTSFDMCVKCAKEYTQGLGNNPVSKPIDVTGIKTPEELLSFINSVSSKTLDKKPCQCGMTSEYVEKNGRFGCTNCYEHFKEFMENIVYPFHNANTHVGKIPRAQMMRKIKENPEEKMKLLKLRYAKAIEIEEYEKAAEINEEIKQLLQSPPSSFSDL